MACVGLLVSTPFVGVLVQYALRWYISPVQIVLVYECSMPCVGLLVSTPYIRQSIVGIMLVGMLFLGIYSHYMCS